MLLRAVANKVKINIKPGKTSKHTSYRTYNVRTKKSSKKWLQQLFADSGAGLYVVGKAKMLHDGAELIREVPEGMNKGLRFLS